MSHLHRIFLAVGVSLLASAAAAQETEVPYWASLRADEVNMRVGPSEEYRINWVYHRAGLPLKVLRIKEGWRLVEDQDGGRGWMLGRFLTRNRSAVVIGSGPAMMRESSSPAGRLLWRLTPGVVGQLGACEEGWCEFSVGARVGFVEDARLWGDGIP